MRPDSPSCYWGVSPELAAPFLKRSVLSPPAFSAPCAGQNPAAHPHPDDAEQQAALLLACSGDTLPASLPPVNMYDLFEALQVTLGSSRSRPTSGLLLSGLDCSLWKPLILTHSNPEPRGPF